MEDSILLSLPDLGNPDSVRSVIASELRVCPTCGHARRSVLGLSKEIGVDRFVLKRLIEGKSPRLSNYLRIVRWIFKTKAKP